MFFELFTGVLVIENAMSLFIPRISPEETTVPNCLKFCMVPSKGILRGIAEGFLEIRSGGPDMGYPRIPGGGPKFLKNAHIWAPRPKFQKPLGYPTQNPLGGYHAKFQLIRLSSFFWRDSGYEK